MQKVACRHAELALRADREFLALWLIVLTSPNSVE